MPVGQGHETFTRYASGRGVNPLSILAPATEPATGRAGVAATRVKVTRVAMRIGSLMLFARRHSRTARAMASRDEGDTMPHRWGMAVDLDKCTGCEACVTACHAENNIPTVGAGRGRRAAARCTGCASSATGRAISRSAREVPAGAVPAVRQRAVRGGVPDVCEPSDRRRAERAGLQPLHRHALLRQRLHVQRPLLQLLQPEWEKPLQLQLNPDVSVREVGVMEKCTFCVQRIKAAKTTAKAEERPARRTARCSRPARRRARPAIVFGDLNDPESRVARLSHSPRGTQAARGSGRRTEDHLPAEAAVE